MNDLNKFLLDVERQLGQFASLKNDYDIIFGNFKLLTDDLKQASEKAHSRSSSIARNSADSAINSNVPATSNANVSTKLTKSSSKHKANTDHYEKYEILFICKTVKTKFKQCHET
jgi:hypothetical protein